jgi:hypothetical protein
LAYNNEGYSEAALAYPSNAHYEVQKLVIEETDANSVDTSQTFTLKFTHNGRTDLATGISIIATPNDLEEALMSLDNVGTVLVTRDDLSSNPGALGVDFTGAFTEAFKLVYHITFTDRFYNNGDLNNLVVDDISGPASITVSSERDGYDSSEYSISTHSRQPTGPQDVSVHVVSNTELGISWAQPVSDGGESITKFLINGIQPIHLRSQRCLPHQITSVVFHKNIWLL